jgi:thymidylate synthase
VREQRLSHRGVRSSQATTPPWKSLRRNVEQRDIKMLLCKQIRPKDRDMTKPFNIASYALLTHMVAQQCDLDVGDFIWTGGDCHIYSNHHEQVQTQLARTPYPYPVLNIKRKPDSIFDYEYEDFEVLDYQCHPAIKAPVAV